MFMNSLQHAIPSDMRNTKKSSFIKITTKTLDLSLMEYFYILTTMVVVSQTNKERGRKVKENSAMYLSKPGK